MGKRVIIVIVVILISALSILGYFLHQSRKSLLTDPYKAIPADACIVIETVDLQNFFNNIVTGNGIFDELGKIKEFERFSGKVRYLNDQLGKDLLKKISNSGSATISFHVSSGAKIEPLLAMTVSGETRIKHVSDMLKALTKNEVIEDRSGSYSIIKVPYKIDSTSDTMYFSLISGLLLCSPSSHIVSDAIIQISSEDDIRDHPGFSRVLVASGKNEDKAFIVFSNLQKAIMTLLKEEAQGLSDKISRLAGTAEGDIYINEEGIIFSGYTESIDSADILFRYKSVSPKEFNTYKYLPSATALFETMIIPERKVVEADRSLPKNVIELANKLHNFLGEEITRAYIDIRDQSVEENTMVIYELANREQAKQYFLEQIGNSPEIIMFQPDDQVNIPVYKISYNGFSEAILKGFASQKIGTYFTFYDNFMITGNSYATISRLLYDNILNKTLANNLNYREFESTLPSRAGYFFYCVPHRITAYLAQFLRSDIAEALTTYTSSLNKIQALGYQFASSNEMIYNSLSIRYKEEVREESTTLWETLLDTTACIKPFFFTNHLTGAREIFIQDLKNNIYLINSAGRVLWKVPLQERISGSVYMIDYYKNGKYQLLFSGRNYIHILDRNGNYVERYPVKLRSPATNSLALFDYDKNLNYRLFIAGEDKLIYSYEKTGNVVKGWRPYKTAEQVKSEISYFRVSGKDYIVASDDKSVYFLDRTGKKRLNLKEAVSRAAGSSMRLINGSEPSLVCTSPDGTIQNIYFDGSVKKFSLTKFSSEHTFDLFDVDGDGFGEYIFIDKGILYLYDHNRSEMFTREFTSTELGGPINFIFSASDRKIGVYDINRKQIYLIDENGDTMNGFPLRGASMFSIGRLSESSGWHLIVGGTDSFLYNYKIDTR